MKKISTLIILLHCLCLQSQSTIFVNKNVQGGLQNGTSWSNAFPDLQQALAVATDGDDIWVAAATYFPTSTTDRSISFVLKQGVKMYGGFNGTETAQNQRDFTLNETILSGNIGAPGGADNSYHILYGTGVDSTTVVDGFVVSRGGTVNANFPNFRGGGLYLEPSPNLYNTCPVIQNCRFEYNFASAGAAIYCSYEFGNVVNPILRDCQFVSNRAATFAGALYKGGPALPNKPFVVENCHFLKNAAFTSEGGGAFLTNTGNTTILRKCTFEKDSASTSLGAGLYYAGFATVADSGTLVLDSCVFKDNYAQEGAGFFLVDFDGKDFGCKIRSCRFEGNKSQNSDGAAFFLAALGITNNKMDVDVQNTIFKDNLSGASYTISISAGFNGNLKANFKNCIFLDNKRPTNPNGINFPIGIGVNGGESKGEVTVENCLFANNGAGVAVLSAEEADVQTNITNCTFYRNGRFIVDKSWYPSFDTSDIHRNDCYITNCIFWEPGSAVNQMFTNNDFTNVNMYNYFIDHSMVSLTSTDIPGGPEAFGDNVIFGTYPMFVDTTNGDFRLHPCSPAVNKGDNMAAIGLIFDLDGNPRIYRDTVDLGAYEVLDSCLTISSKEPNARASIALSPNPVHTGSELFVRLRAEENPGKLNWTVVDICGKQIGRGFCENALTESFSVPAPRTPGVYFLQIQGAGVLIQMKFVVCE